MIWKKHSNNMYYGAWGDTGCEDCNASVVREAGHKRELRSAGILCGCGKEVLRDPTEGLNMEAHNV